MSFGYMRAKATRILATHCCICCRELVDAKSVEVGIGPVCRKRYGDPDIETTDDMLRQALGALVVSKLPDKVVDECMRHKGDARKVCNILVYHASANYDDKEFVLSVSPVVRLLGYTKLADKLENTRSTVKLVNTDDGFVHVFAPKNDNLTWGYRKMGARIIRHDSGRFKCWAVPATMKPSLALLLGYGFGGEHCHVVPVGGGEAETYKIDPASWSAFEASLPKPKPKPAPVVPTNAKGLPLAPAKGVRIETKGDRFTLYTPFSWDFVKEIRKIRGRRWHNGIQANSFPNGRRAKVADLVESHFGVAIGA